jgi:ATP-dependent RNA helicase DHX57
MLLVILHIPECDLPERMLPENNSSNSFVVSTHAGTSNLKTRWIEDRATKEAGFPTKPVKQCTTEKPLSESWDLTIAALNRMLIGEEWKNFLPSVEGSEAEEEAIIHDDELEGIWAYYTETGQLVLPINTADIQVNFILGPEQKHISPSAPPPMYITSRSVPPYVRLHLLALLLRGVRTGEIASPGVGFLIECMGALEAEWAVIEENGPPDISEVLKYLLPPPEEVPATDDDVNKVTSGQKGRRKTGKRRVDERSDAQVRKDWETACRKSEYVALLKTRERLPSFAAKGEFLSMLDKNRVVVVVGETGAWVL